MKGKFFQIFFFLIIAFFISKFIPYISFPKIIGATLIFSFFIISFLIPEFGLSLIIFSMLLSPEIKILSFPGRDLVIRLEDILLTIVIFSWIAKVSIEKELTLFRKTPLNIPIILYLLVCILATSINILQKNSRIIPAKSFFNILKYMEYFFLFFMVSNFLKEKKQIKKFLYLFLFVGLIISLYGIYSSGKYGRATAPFEGEIGEPNTLGGYFLLLLGIISGWFLYSDEKYERFILGGLAFIMIVPFLFTLSRASYMAFPFMFLTLFLTKKRKMFLIFLLFFIISFSLIGLPSKVRDRIRYTFTGEKGYPEQVKIGKITFDPSASARVISWRESVSAWKEKPFFGYGVEGLRFIDGQYVKVLVETGIFGIITFLFLLFSIFKSIWGKFKNPADLFYEGVSLGLLASFIGLLVHSIGTNTFIIIRIMEPFWFLTAIVINSPSSQ